MDSGRKKIKVTYSSTNEKNIKDVISTLIKTHEESRNDYSDKKVAVR